MRNIQRFSQLVLLALVTACGAEVELKSQTRTLQSSAAQTSEETVSLEIASSAQSLTDAEALVHSSVFDCEFYRKKYLDLSSFTCEQAQEHWVSYGAPRGRTAHKLFRANEYLMLYEDLRNQFGTDLVAATRHFARFGASEGRAGRLLFSPRVFDCKFYIETYMSDVTPAPTCDAAKSDFAYTIEANFERAGNRIFDPHEYVAIYPDIKKVYTALTSFFDHFVRTGFTENRAGNMYTIPTYFKCEYYRTQSPMFLDKDCLWLRTHWMQTGLQQGLQASNEFSIREFLVANPLLKERFGNNFWLAWHYKVRFEGATPYSLVQPPSASFSKDGRTLYNITAGPELDPTGKVDSTVGIAKVIEKAVNFANANSGSKVWVKFPAGTFRLSSCLAWDAPPPSNRPYPLAEPGTCFGIYNAKNLLISGEGERTLFVNNNPEAGVFRVRQGTGVYLESFAIDYNPLPFVQGVVSNVTVTGSTVEVTVDTTSDTNNISASILQKYLSKGSHIPMSNKNFPWLRKRNSLTMFRYDSVTQGSNQLKFTVTNAYALANIPKQIAVNDGFVYTARQSSAQALEFVTNTDIGLHNVFVYTSPGVAASVLENSGEIVVDGLVVRRRSGVPLRHLTSNSDGVHATNNRSAVRVQNSYFEGMGDDAINIGSSGAVVSVISSDKKVVTTVGNKTLVGDTLQFVNPLNMEPLGVRNVIAAKAKGAGVFELTLDSPIEGVNTNNGKVPALPPISDRSWTNTVAFNLSKTGAGSIVTNNIFGPHRARNVLMKAPGGSITDNSFIMVDMSAVLVEASTFGFIEGPIPQNISVRNNKFWANGGADPAIVFGVDALGTPVVPTITNVTLADNAFLTCANSCVEFFGVKTGSIMNNVFDAVHSQKRLGVNPIVHIHDSNVAGISQSGNTIKDRRRETPPQ